jgi:hypothetical protein
MGFAATRGTPEKCIIEPEILFAEEYPLVLNESEAKGDERFPLAVLKSLRVGTFALKSRT